MAFGMMLGKKPMSGKHTKGRPGGGQPKNGSKAVKGGQPKVKASASHKPTPMSPTGKTTNASSKTIQSMKSSLGSIGRF